MRFSRDRLCQQGLAGSGRSHQQRALGELRADLGISSRIMQEIHHLLQGLLCLVLARHILEGDAGLPLHIDLGIALSHTLGAAASGHLAHQEVKEDDDRHKGKHIGQEDRQDQTGAVRNLFIDLHAVFEQKRRSRFVVHHARIVGDLRLLHKRIIRVFRLRNDGDPGIPDLHPLHAARFHHLQEFVIGDLLAGNTAQHPHEKAHTQKRLQRGDQDHHQILPSRRLSSRALRSLRPASLAIAVVIAAAVIIVHVVIVHS